MRSGVGGLLLAGLCGCEGPAAEVAQLQFEVAALHARLDQVEAELRDLQQHREVGQRVPRARPRPPSGESTPPERTRGEPVVVEVARAEVEPLWTDLDATARLARVIPHFSQGRMEGYKLIGIRPDSIVTKLGLQNGDTIIGVDGRSLDDPTAALEAYTTLREADRIELTVVRRGAQFPLTIEVK